MNNENLSNFIDQGAFDDFIKLEKALNSAQDSLDSLCQSAVSLNKELSNIGSLKDLITYSNQVADTNKKVVESVNNVKTGVKLLNEEQIKHNMSIKEANDYLKLQIAAQNTSKDTIAGMRAEISLLTYERSKLNLVEQAGEAERRRAELDAKNAALKMNVDAYTAQKINIGNYPEAMGQINALKAEMDALAATGQKDSAEFVNLSGKLKEFQNALGGPTKEIQYVTTTMGTLVTRMGELREAGQMDTAEFKLMQEQFEQLSLRGAELKAQLAQVSLAIKEQGAMAERGSIAMEKLGSTVKEIGNFAITFFGIQAGMEFISGISEEFEKADKAARNLKNTLENVGAANLFDKLTKDSAEFAEKFSYLDTYQVQDVFSKLITYGKLTEDQIKEALPVIIDFAAKTGKSLDESASVIIKALEGNAKGLKEFGINIIDAKDEMGKAIPQGERFGFIMEQLKPRVEGAGKAFESGWSGVVETWKKNIREIELGIADLIVKMTGIDEKNFETAVSARKEADELTKLTTEYKNISEKVNLTSQDKQRLGEITSHLTALYGESVVNIDKETGAMTLNLEATKALITQKMLLANTEGAKYANIYANADEEKWKALDKVTQAQNIYNESIKNYGFNVDQVFQKLKPPSGMAGDNWVPHLTPSEEDIIKLYQNIGKAKDVYQKYIDVEIDAADHLEKLGFKREDVDKLYHPDILDPGKNIPKTPGGEKPDKEYILQNEKALSAAMFAQWQENVKMSAAAQKEILDNELESYEDRKKALFEYHRLQAQLNQGEISNQYGDKQFEIANMQLKPKESQESFTQRKKIANEELVDIELKYNGQVLQDKRDLNEGLKKLDANYLDYKLGMTKYIQQANVELETKELNALKEQYDKGAITWETYIAKRKKVHETFMISTLLLEKAFYEEQLKLYSPGSPEFDKINALLSQVNKSIADVEGNQKKDKSKADTSNSVGYLLNKVGVGDDANSDTQAAIKLTGELMKAEKAQHDAKIANLERQKQLIDDTYQAQIAAVNGTFENQQKKEAQLAVLAANKAAQDKAINDEITREKRKEAENDKLASIAKIVADGAAAVVKALPNYILAGIVAATAAVELGVAASAQLPQYGKGTGIDGHPGGDAIVGELNKPEYIFKPGASIAEIVNRATKMNLPKGTRVIPEEDLLRDAGEMLPDSMHHMAMQFGMEQIIRQEMSRVSDEIVDLKEVVRNKRENYLELTSNGFRQFVKNGNSMTEYLDSNF